MGTHNSKESISTISYKVIGFLGIAISTSLVLMIAISSLAQIVLLPINGSFFPLSLIASAVIAIRIIKISNAKIAAVSCVLLILIYVLCFAVSALFLDLSVDGNMYHKQAISALANGWNPLLGSWADSSSYIPQPLEEDFYLQQLSPTQALWLDSYSQGVWRLAACFYSFIPNIECSKAYTMLSMISSISIFGYYLSLKQCFRGDQIVIAMLIATTNPVVLAQIESFYVDGFLGINIFILVIGLVMAIDEQCASHRKLAYLIVAIGVIGSTAAKLTGLAYSAVFCISFFVMFCIKVARKNKGFDLKSLRRLMLFAVILVIADVFIISYSPMVLNVVNHGNPLYPLIGEGSVDIMTSNSPRAFVGESALHNLIYSIFSSVSNIYYSLDFDPAIKIPFTVNDYELSILYAADLRISGFGVLYSGIFIVLVLAILVALVVSRKRFPFFFQCSICFILPMLFLVLFIKESWWARYSPYTYYSVFVALLFFFLEANQGKTQAKVLLARICALVLVILIALNSYFWVRYGIKQNLDKSLQAHETLNTISTLSDQGDTIGVAVRNPLYGFLIDIEDANIDYSLIELDEAANYEASINDFVFFDIE